MRRPVKALALAIVALAGSAGASAFVVSKRTHVVTVNDAVSRFRSKTAAPDLGPAGAASSPVADTAAAGAAAAGTSGEAAVPSQGAATAVVARGLGKPVSLAATKKPAPDAPRGVGAASPAIATPRDGVYSYDTTGGERVSALGGASHTYPATTTISVTGSGCSQLARWDALRERYDQRGLCAVGQGTREITFVSHHSFFGQVDTKTYSCDASTMVRPDSTKVGASSTGTCIAPNAKAVVTSSIEGVESVRVGDIDVAAVKVHIDEALTGATQGHAALDTWYSLADNTLLRRTADVDADTDSSIGQTHYVEHYTLKLASLTPQT